MNKKASEFQCPGKGSFKSQLVYESRTQVFTLELKKGFVDSFHIQGNHRAVSFKCSKQDFPSSTCR